MHGKVVRAASRVVLAMWAASAAAPDPALVLLFFTAPWCEPCRAVYPILHAFEQRHKEEVRLLAVDFDVDTAEAERWDVTQIPVVIAVARDGRPLLRVDGADRETLSKLAGELGNALARSRKIRRH